MAKSRTTVKIAGKEYTISSFDEPAWVQRVAGYVDRRMSELYQASHLPSAQLAVLTAVNATDDMLKAQDEVTRLRTELDIAREKIELLEREKAELQ